MKIWAIENSSLKIQFLNTNLILINKFSKIYYKGNNELHRLIILTQVHRCMIKDFMKRFTTKSCVVSYLVNLITV